jgi:hypothetical protein
MKNLVLLLLHWWLTVENLVTEHARIRRWRSYQSQLIALALIHRRNAGFTLRPDTETSNVARSCIVRRSIFRELLFLLSRIAADAIAYNTNSMDRTRLICRLSRRSTGAGGTRSTRRRPGRTRSPSSASSTSASSTTRTTAAVFFHPRWLSV